MASKAFGGSMWNPFFMMVSDDKPDKPKTARTDDPEVQAAAERQAAALRRRRGRASTIVTGPTGVTEDPETKRTTLG